MSSTTDITSLFANAAVPAFKCPEGPKIHFLNLGTLECDENYIGQCVLGLPKSY